MPAEGDHRHCKVCGKVCAASAETCSRTCAEERERRVRSSRNLRYVLYGTIALLLVLFLSNFLHP